MQMYTHYLCLFYMVILQLLSTPALFIYRQHQNKLLQWVDTLAICFADVVWNLGTGEGEGTLDYTM